MHLIWARDPLGNPDFAVRRIGRSRKHGTRRTTGVVVGLIFCARLRDETGIAARPCGHRQTPMYGTPTRHASNVSHTRKSPPPYRTYVARVIRATPPPCAVRATTSCIVSRRTHRVTPTAGWYDDAVRVSHTFCAVSCARACGFLYVTGPWPLEISNNNIISFCRRRASKWCALIRNKY